MQELSKKAAYPTFYALPTADFHTWQIFPTLIPKKNKNMESYVLTSLDLSILRNYICNIP